MGTETVFQMGSSLIFRDDLSTVDIADIGLAGVFGKYSFVGQAFIDYNFQDGLSTTFGFGEYRKSLFSTGIELGVGFFNLGHSELLNISEINKNVVTIYNNAAGAIRRGVGEYSKTKE